MDSLPRKPVSAREKAIEELVQGHESAAQLQLVLHDQLLTGTAHESTTTPRDLVTKTLRSFTEALSILGYTEPSKISAATSPSRKLLKKQPKMRNMQETWTKITSELIEDGYAWRKYGQKEILKAKHLRCYYRCSYRFDQGCQATKQVQRTEDKPPTFWTKYMGHHTCQDILEATLGMDSTVEEGVLLSFELNTTKKQVPPFFSSSLPSSNPSSHEILYKKTTIPSIEEGYKPFLPPECFSPAQDLNSKFKSSMIPPSALPSTSKLGPEDLVSGSSSSSSSFDTDMDLTDPVCFDSELYDEKWF